MQKVTVVIDEKGDFTVDMQGFHGKGCQKLMDEISGGAKPIFTNTKREFSETVTAQEQVKQR